jgi:hypothetical protein
MCHCLARLNFSCQQSLAFGLLAGRYYAFGLAAARRLGVRTAVRSAIRWGVVATLGATDDERQFLLVECPQGLLGQCELLVLLNEKSLLPYVPNYGQRALAMAYRVFYSP